MDLLRPTRVEIASDGLLPVANILREEGCRWFGVAIPEEALALREAVRVSLIPLRS